MSESLSLVAGSEGGSLGSRAGMTVVGRKEASGFSDLYLAQAILIPGEEYSRGVDLVETQTRKSRMAGTQSQLHTYLHCKTSRVEWDNTLPTVMAIKWFNTCKVPRGN